MKIPNIKIEEAIGLAGSIGIPAAAKQCGISVTSLRNVFAKRKLEMPQQKKGGWNRGMKGIKYSGGWKRLVKPEKPKSIQHVLTAVERDDTSILPKFATLGISSDADITFSQRVAASHNGKQKNLHLTDELNRNGTIQVRHHHRALPQLQF